MNELLAENNRRIALYFRQYDRITGDPQGEVVPRSAFSWNGTPLYLPVTMTEQPIYRELCHTTTQAFLRKYTGECTPRQEKQFFEGFIRDRLRHDFEFWAYTCVKIQDKLTKRPIPFSLNRGQRRLVAKFEEMRTAGLPVRVILVKARQWGGSTATQIYMLWLQLFHYHNWHSAIVTQYKQQAANIRGMISRVLAAYPPEVQALSFTGYEGMNGIKYIPQRGCIVGTGSAENPDALRSFDFAMLHLSEVGLWRSTLTKNADDLVQSLYATVPDVPGSFIVMESTAKGIGNFFHLQYQAAAGGESDLRAVFVPWFEIEMYATFRRGASGEVLHTPAGLPLSALPDPARFASTLTAYEQAQWESGATLEGIHWYRTYKRGKRYNDFQMRSEFPTTDDEAFQSNSTRYYEETHIQACRRTCKDPAFIGDLRGYSASGREALHDLRFVEDGNGQLAVWAPPENSPGEKITHRYLVTVDIGGKHYRSDWSVISVFDRLMLTDPNGALERVPTYTAHIDHDLLAWKAAQIATWYGNALLVIESNTLETRDRKQDDTLFEGDHFYTVFNEIADVYPNLYARNTPPENTRETVPLKYGWHTNKRTKYLAYDRSRAAIRDGEYIERDRRCVDEMAWLETKPDGSLGAIDGRHDDLIDTTAIAIYISSEEMPLPRRIPTPPHPTSRRRSPHSAHTPGGVATL